LSLNHIALRASIGAFVIGLSFTPATSARTASAVSRPAIAIDNFARVSDNYYRGAQPEGRDYADLAALGVKTVIDLQADGDQQEADFVAAAGMKFFRIPLTTRTRPEPDAIARFLSLVNDPANQPVFVHCRGGHHRTGIMTAVYRMTNDGWTAERAYEEMQQYGFGPAFLHATLKSFVYEYVADPVRARASLPAVVATGRDAAAATETTATPAGDAQFRQ
jgi:uncharacterized protein (TIGR01244 family)